MKRISLLSILLFSILCAFTEGRDYGYIPVRYRTHWSPYSQSLVSGLVEYSPYALKYNSSGLICDTYDYSPYALKYNSSGLIDCDVDYNPYAFGYNKSGLVSNTGPGCCGTYNSGVVINIIHRNVPVDKYIGNHETESFYDYAEKIKEETVSDRKASLEKQKAQLEKNKQQKANDPSEAIREFLDSKNIRFRANRYLRMDGETVSVNFNIEDANIIIKFWNSKVISEFAENDKYKKKVFDNYLKSWEEYYLNNIGNSKKVFNIISGSREELFEQLSFYDNLKSDDILYASNQNQSSTLINQ